MAPKAAPNNRPKTQNIREPQILLYQPDDVDGIVWHHRILVLQVKGAKWVSLDPELELQVIDLDTLEYVLLDKDSDFPADKIGDAFPFEPIPQSEIPGFRRKARTLLALHSEGPSDAEELVWVICDPRDAYFSTIIPQDRIDAASADGTMIEGGAKGIVEHEEEFRFIEQVTKTELEGVLKKWRAADSDSRILKVQRDQAGKRNRPLSDAVPVFTEEKMDDWPHVGDRSFMEASDAVLRTSANWKTYHLTWKQESGIAPGSSLCHEHETLCESFRLSHEIDQLNCGNLAAHELLMRRMIQIEMAVSRNSKAPDFTGLSVVLSSVTDGSGAIQTRGFHKWVADKNESRARIMKSERLYHEERGIAKKKQKGEGKGKGDKKGGRGGADASSAGQG